MPENIEQWWTAWDIGSKKLEPVAAFATRELIAEWIQSLDEDPNTFFLKQGWKAPVLAGHGD